MNKQQIESLYADPAFRQAMEDAQAMMLLGRETEAEEIIRKAAETYLQPQEPKCTE